MKFIGIDPGLEGALALYDKEVDKVLEVVDIPTRERVYGTGKEVDWEVFKDRLYNLYPDSYPDEEMCMIVLENVGVMPSQGITSAFAFGQVVGGIRAVIETMSLPYMLIHPATWKKSMGLIGTEKGAIIPLVLNAYPEVAHYLKLKKHHNRADAIAIAVAGANKRIS